MTSDAPAIDLSEQMTEVASLKLFQAIECLLLHLSIGLVFRDRDGEKITTTPSQRRVLPEGAPWRGLEK